MIVVHYVAFCGGNGIQGILHRLRRHVRRIVSYWQVSIVSGSLFAQDDGVAVLIYGIKCARKRDTHDAEFCDVGGTRQWPVGSLRIERRSGREVELLVHHSVFCICFLLRDQNNFLPIWQEYILLQQPMPPREAKKPKKAFRIEPIHNKGDAKYAQLGKHVPYPLPGWNGKPFVMTLLGKRGSGKTVTLIRLIQAYAKGAFDEIAIFSPNVVTDDNYEELVGLENISIEAEVENDLLKRVIQFQKDRMEKEKAGLGACPVVLFVFDDEGGKFRSKDLKKAVSWLYTQSRHAKIGGIITCLQSLTQYDSLFISQTTAWVIWPYEARSLKKITKELATNLVGTEDLAAFINFGTALEPPHSFVYINTYGGRLEDCYFVHSSKGFEAYDMASHQGKS